MENGYIAREYQKMSPQDRRTFDRWLTANAVIGCILAAGIIAMAFAGAWLSEPGDVAIAERAKPPVMASERPVPRSGIRNVQYPSR